jgi:hypothetical protein
MRDVGFNRMSPRNASTVSAPLISNSIRIDQAHESDHASLSTSFKSPASGRIARTALPAGNFLVIANCSHVLSAQTRLSVCRRFRCSSKRSLS